MAFMTRRQAPQNYRLAPRAHAGIGLAALGLDDLLDNGGAAHDQVMQ
jgi:hypothetical protein